MCQIWLFLATFCCFHILAQNRVTLSGYVEDSESHERLIGANVFVPGTSYGTITNAFGFYSLTIPSGNFRIHCSYIGYQAQEDSLVIANGNVSLDFQLARVSTTLLEVEVTSDHRLRHEQFNSVKLSSREIKSIPAIFGEVDVLKAIQLLPGVQSGVEGSTGFHVRGGSPDQNLILLDGVPVYNASHLFGFFSVFNADAIKNVQLTKGGFPARFGGRLSSILEIDLKEGNMKEFHGEGTIGLISSKLTLEGPIVTDKASFIVSGRRTYFDVLTKLAMPMTADRLNYYFGDLTAKINYNISRKDRVYLSFYSGVDDFMNNIPGLDKTFEQSLKWGNVTGSLRWNHLYSSKLFSNLTATYTRYILSSAQREVPIGAAGGQDVEKGYENYSSIRDIGLNYDFEYSWTVSHTLNFGTNYTFHSFRPSAAQYSNPEDKARIDSLRKTAEEITSHENFLYIEDSWDISNRLRLNYGLNYSWYLPNGTFYSLLQPRASARYLFTDQWSVNGSYALMNQYVHLLTNTGVGLPTDLWVTSTESVRPQKSQQVTLGTHYLLDNNKYDVSAELYYKWMTNLIAYKEGATFEYSKDWEALIETDGRGWSYGLEILARKNTGKFTGWVGYTLGWSNRQFDNINDGRLFPYKYDRRHDINFTANYTINERISVGATWVYTTGQAFTSPVAVYQMSSNGGATMFKYSDRNEFRYPGYHRMDLGVSFSKKKKWGERVWSLSLYNAYNRNNPFFVYAYEEEKSREVKMHQVSIFPIIPSVSYSFKF